MDNVIVNKSASIERCLKRVEEEFAAAGDAFLSDFTRQDAAVLNLLRACEQSIDLANYIISKRKLGVPQTSWESYELLWKANVLPEALTNTMKAMVGFRNIAIHNYTKLDMEIVENIIETHLGDIKQFTEVLLRSGE